MMKMKTLAAVAAAFAVSAPVFADSKLNLDDVLTASGITVSGRVEAGYDIANTKATPTSVPSPEFAYFNKGDSFVFHQAALNIVKAPVSGVGGAITVIAGDDAKALTNSLTGSDVYLLQGYVSYATGALTVIGGRFLTLAGVEVIDPSANFNASRGIVFNTQPFFHTGVRATYKVSEALSLTGGLVNSVNGPGAIDTNHMKTLELNATLVAGILTNSLTAYVGKEVPQKSVGTSLTIDYVGTLAVSPALTLAVNGDYYNYDDSAVAGSKTKNGYAVAGYANYKLDAVNRVALRAEYVDGKDNAVAGGLATTAGPSGVLPKSLTSYTLTLGHALTSNFEVTAEGRLDDATKGSQTFATKKGDTEYIGSIRAVYKF